MEELNLSPTASHLDGDGFTDRREEHLPIEIEASALDGT